MTQAQENVKVFSLYLCHCTTVAFGLIGLWGVLSDEISSLALIFIAPIIATGITAIAQEPNP